MEYIYRYASPLGGITVASDGEALIGLWFDGQKYYADTLGDCYEEKNLPIFGETAQWLDIYFGGEDSWLCAANFPACDAVSQESGGDYAGHSLRQDDDLWGNR